MEEIQGRHRTQQRQLQSRITQKMKNATKKTRKGVKDECEALERDLREQQQAELDALQADHVTGNAGKVGVEEEGETIVDDSPHAKDEVLAPGGRPEVNMESAMEGQNHSKKPSRQKARLARRAAEQETLVAEAEAEAANAPDLRALEMAAMQEHTKKLGLQEISIQPDGHCLYSAVATGLPDIQIRESGPYSVAYQNVRYKTADFISTHSDDFTAFLEEPLETYVKKVKDTAEWGGQVELQAIARAYQVEIHVLQADGRVEKIESEGPAKQAVWLAYYRHGFGLGEHYNALKQD